MFLTHKEIEERIRQIIAGLYFLKFKCKLLHRIIKPGNILLFKNSTQLKLADMGCVKLIGIHESNQTTFLKGTPAFL